MSLAELTSEQISKLKQRYLIEHIDGGASYSELVWADELVSMAQIEEEYGATHFVEDDF